MDQQGLPDSSRNQSPCSRAEAKTGTRKEQSLACGDKLRGKGGQSKARTDAAMAPSGLNGSGHNHTIDVYLASATAIEGMSSWGIPAFLRAAASSYSGTWEALCRLLVVGLALRQAAAESRCGKPMKEQGGIS